MKSRLGKADSIFKKTEGTKVAPKVSMRFYFRAIMNKKTAQFKTSAI
jgi:hypothetical protein